MGRSAAVPVATEMPVTIIVPVANSCSSIVTTGVTPSITSYVVSLAKYLPRLFLRAGSANISPWAARNVPPGMATDVTGPSVSIQFSGLDDPPGAASLAVMERPLALRVSSPRWPA